jgi:simple sugar transport system permease protein
VFVPIVAVLLGLVTGGLVLWVAGISPISAYVSMFESSLGSTRGLTATLLRAAPLMLTGLAVAFALRMQLWNIGAEGQLLLGAAGATAVFFALPDAPGWALLPLAALAAAIAGALWAFIAAAPRALIGLNEIITTLFLNYIALRLVSFLVYGPWQDPEGKGFAYSRPIPAQGLLGTIWGTDVTTGIVLSLAFVVLAWYTLARTRWGFSTQILGGNPSAGVYLGIEVRTRIVSVLMVSGAIAGIAGFLQLTAVTGRLQPDIASGYGYTGILLAFLAGRSLLMLPIATILFSALIQGGYSLQSEGLSNSISVIIQGVIILFVLVGGVGAAYRLRLVRSGSSRSTRSEEAPAWTS